MVLLLNYSSPGSGCSTLISEVLFVIASAGLFTPKKSC